MDQRTTGRSPRQGPFDHPPSSPDPGEGRFRRVDGGATRAFGCLREAVPIHGALVAAVVRSSRAGRALHPDRLPGGTGRGGPRVDRGSHPVLPAPEREGSRAVLAPLPGTGGGVQDRRRRPRGPRSAGLQRTARPPPPGRGPTGGLRAGGQIREAIRSPISTVLIPMFGPPIASSSGNTDTAALSSAPAASDSPRWSRHRAIDRTVATGLAQPLPAMSGADPWTGSNIDGKRPSGSMLPEAARPIPP